MKHQTIVILDFGGQYNQLIARRVRENNVYSVVVPNTATVSEIKAMSPSGIIFTGGPNSVYDPNSPKISPEIFDLGIPVLGICYGAQLMSYTLGGNVERAATREYGQVDITLGNSLLFDGVKCCNKCLMSHTDRITDLPDGFIVTAYTDSCPVAAFENAEKNLYGVQFHPEVNHTLFGRELIANFLFKICKVTPDWNMANYAKTYIEFAKEKIGDKKVLCALSGGVDSSVAALLLYKAIGSQLTCIFVDHGMLRKDEGDQVEQTFKEQFNMDIIRVNAEDRFLSKLKGVDEPEQKRKIIGEEFIRVFEEEAKKIGTVDFLVQGTIYPDVIESGKDDSAVIKSHHNVGGLPDYVDFKEIIEPLRDLFKDEVRRLGIELGLPDEFVWRQPFPGPGLAVRCMGEITKDKLAILKEADAIFREEIKNAGMERDINQYFAVITNMRSVGVMGDERTYDYAVALRAVETTDFMTGSFSHIPYEVLGKVSARIVNEVKHVNRVLYDVTNKPPATIEFE